MSPNMFRYCEVFDHPMGPAYCDLRKHPACATCTEELWPATGPADDKAPVPIPARGPGEE